MIKQKNYGRLHFYADKKTKQILGCEMCAPAGEHLAHFISVLIQKKMTVEEALKLTFYHPVIEEGLRTALRELV